jgi:hypothetical protein
MNIMNMCVCVCVCCEMTPDSRNSGARGQEKVDVCTPGLNWNLLREPLETRVLKKGAVGTV